jgi:hypothetical protein
VNPAPDDIRERIRNVLLTDWDPSNAARIDAARGEYDSYIDPLWELISGGADAQAVIDYLRQRELESMCFPSIGKSHLPRVAEKLLALRS